MTEYKHRPMGLPVPDGRLSRLARLGGMAAGVAGNIAVNGGRQLVSGQRPKMNDLLLTPANAARITSQLAQMRGAAMKMGQLMSMEGGDFIPPELAEILGHLRADAHYMPPAQLKKVLSANWGADFLKRFKRFDVRPIAAASIGQVHRAQTKDGRDVAIKVQYPGVRKSIDSDVSNVASLLRLTGLLPKELDIAPMLAEAKRQLHEEADYQREGDMLDQFGILLADDPRFVVPQLHPDLTTENILGMDYIDGVAIETLTDASQDTRDTVMNALVALVVQELFEFKLMQTDPNFANYRYDPDTGKVVLLDFGATRPFSDGMVERYRQLLRAGLSDDREARRAAMIEIGFFTADTQPKHQNQILDMFAMAMEPVQAGGTFDFAETDLAGRLRMAGMEIAAERDFWHIPPMDTLYVQRKMGGIYLLASRLKARINLSPLIAAAT
ncbi:AarF/ABC1/UbiB kinase family protein [Actibacterium sp. 188UL27-1]|uniref:ABC1 kinase family protein n=1 Tax=Actibacterium sp. 188UL27-1 TaxID=2786961 RepID=UPI00195760BB|nr:AarF/ABC1/UbiB kinase family protein [Actibacterium sp. 188UL27-1]MBM7066446.1 AarF/ABC1/UbiB kinase family protein [Actibacterium sp. 188UL27-1]